MVGCECAISVTLLCNWDVRNEGGVLGSTTSVLGSGVGDGVSRPELRFAYFLGDEGREVGRRIVFSSAGFRGGENGSRDSGLTRIVVSGDAGNVIGESSSERCTVSSYRERDLEGESKSESVSESSSA